MQNINATKNSILAISDSAIRAGGALLNKVASAFAPAEAELALA
jgi:hypothetical protein